LTMGASDSKEMQGLPMGAFVEGETAPVLDEKCFQSIHAFLFLFLYFFFFQESNQGTLPWCGDQWWQC
jgi:hypothetical protein